MAKLASLADAKSILRYDGSGQDAIIETALDAASSHILGYLGVDEDEFDNDSSDPGFVVPHRVEMACIMYAGIMLRDPSGAESEQYEHGYLPRVVMNLVYQFRSPAASASSGSSYPDANKWWLP